MKYNTINGHDFYNMFVNASNKLSEQSEFVNALNVFPVPDGDTGTNMSMTLKAAVEELKGASKDSIGDASRILAKGALLGARGNSGVILSQILRGLSKGFEGVTEATPENLKAAFEEGCNSAYKAVMRPTEGTILSVIRAAAEETQKIETDDVTEFLEQITKASKVMLDKTPEMLPALKKAKVVDSGGMGLYIILSAITDALKSGITADIKDIDIAKGSPQSTGARSDSQAEIKFAYCTEFIILGDAKKAKEFQDSIENLGDCMIVVGYEDVIKVHIHTNDPGAVLSKAVTIGELSKIKIDNMREEHRELFDFEAAVAEKNEEIETKKYGIISVAMGDGIRDIFKDLGVDYVIEGGQTMNPSTKDIVDCINQVNAEHIFILPNNKNIIMAAEQAAELSDKDVRVIKTTSITQGITCVTMFSTDSDVEQNEKTLTETISNVKSGSVTYAVRDTEIEGKEVHEGNILGLVENKITEVGTDKFEVASKIIEQMVDNDSELITILYGQDVSEDEVSSFVSKLEEKYEDFDVQCYSGEQPLYYFFISVE